VATFVLIHMACAGAWAWGRVPELLRDAGHEAIAPDLDLSAGQTPQTHAAAVAALVREVDGVVLAGHSYGGMVVPPLAEMCEGLVQRLIVLDGFMPDDGQSLLSMRSPEIAADRRAAAAERGDGLWPPLAASPGDPEWMNRLVPMPLSAFEEPVRVTPPVAALPGTFIRCTRSDLGRQAERARSRGWRVVEVEATHFAPLTRPEVCAQAFLEAGAGGASLRREHPGR
jgi:pimeloyl-ACP methyl ester carboxylesterase